MSTRNQSNTPITNPFALRLTDDERAELKRRAGKLALGTYIKLVLFADGDKSKHRGARAPIKDHQLLGQLLACLGSSRISESMDRLASAAESGTLVWDEDAPVAIQKASQDIIAMRLMLMKALGFQVDEREFAESLSQTFTRAAVDSEEQSFVAKAKNG